MGLDINSPFAQALIAEGKLRGYSPYDIAGNIGNANAENGLRTSGMPGDNGTAFGGMQWREGRFEKLKATAQKMGVPWTDPKAQAAHWYNEQDAEGNKGATSVEDANDNAIYSLKPGGFKPNDASYAGVSQFDNRLQSSKDAYAALTGGQSPAAAEGDVPATGATEAQGVLSQSQMPQPTMSDSLDRLSAAFFMRDSPAAAKAINDRLSNQMYYQQQALTKAQAATAKFSDDGKQFKANDGKTYTTVTGTDGSRRYNEVPVDQAKAPDPDEPPTRQEVQATAAQNIAHQAAGQLEPVRDAVNTLRDALQKGTFQVGPDKTGKMVVNNLTGNSTENDRNLKSMESNIILAATTIAAAQKGSLTNFKFAKDLEAVMPAFSKYDNKAAYESLTRVSHGLAAAHTSAVNAASTYGRQFKNLSTMVDPNTGEQISVADYYKNKTKGFSDREKQLDAGAPAFLAGPGRNGDPAKPKSFYDSMQTK